MAGRRYKRLRASGAGLTPLTIAIMHVGSGISHMDEDELKALWWEFGEAVEDHVEKKFGSRRTFVGETARIEGWKRPKSVTA